MDEYVEGNAFVGGYPIVKGQAVIGRLAAVWGQAVVGADESGEDVLLSDYSDKRVGSDDIVNTEFMEAKFNDDVEPNIVDEDSRDRKRGQNSHLEFNSYDNLSDTNKEVKMVVDSSDVMLSLALSN